MAYIYFGAGDVCKRAPQPCNRNNRPLIIVNRAPETDWFGIVLSAAVPVLLTQTFKRRR